MVEAVVASGFHRQGRNGQTVRAALPTAPKVAERVDARVEMHGATSRAGRQKPKVLCAVQLGVHVMLGVVVKRSGRTGGAKPNLEEVGGWLAGVA